MTRRLSRSARGVLSSQQVKSYSKAGTYADGGNLYLKISKGGGKSWGFKFYRGKQRYMGLGPYPDISLAEARILASDARKLLLKGIDPLQERRRTRRDNPTFQEASKLFTDANKSGWTPKYYDQVVNAFATYTKPISQLPLNTIETADVLACLTPIWESKTETANRLRGKIEGVLDYATAMELREGPNPARWKGHLSHLLPNPSTVTPVQHLNALPYDDIPEFMIELRSRDGLSRKALEFTILTAMRVGAVVGSKWDEIDGNIWNIPAARMKGMTKDFKVPLSPDAQRVLKNLPTVNDFVFHSTKGHLTVDAPRVLLQQSMGYKHLTVHGFRSTFRDWSAERTSYANHIPEMALAHSIGNKVEQSYRRGDLFAKRARLMQEWANYLNSPSRGAIPIRAKIASP